MPTSRSFPVALLAAVTTLTLGGCGPAAAPTNTAQQPPPGSRPVPEVHVNTGPGPTLGNNGGPVNTAKTSGNSQRQKQLEFINRIRQSDPQGKVIDRAVMNQEDELGLILDRTVQMDEVPKLLQAMLAQMAKEFPNEDLNVHAYAPSNPPLKIGTAHLDARTRAITYTAARR